MNDHEMSDAPARMAQGALGAWWMQGARTAFFRRPDWTGLQTTPASIVCLTLVAYALALLLERLAIDGRANFYWPALQAGWLSTLVSAWACWLLVPRSHGDVPPGSRPPSAGALLSMMVAQVPALSIVLAMIFIPMQKAGAFASPGRGWWLWWASSLLAVGWFVAAQLLLVWRSGSPRWQAKAVVSAMLLGVAAVNQWLLPVQHWYPAAPVGTEGAPEPLQLTQELMEQQSQVLPRALDALRAPDPRTVNVYAITFAPYAEEDVFRNESGRVAEVMQTRFGATDRTVQLVNHRATLSEHAWATPLNLERAIQGVAKTMDRDKDVLFIHLTSHGARDGMLSAWFWPMTVEPVTPQLLRRWLDAAGVRHRIVSISACYSGSWIEPLATPETLVMTAADADHTSFGCGRGSSLTYFGRAMFDEALRHTWSFEQAHATARTVIEQREREAGKSDGYSNPQIRVGPEIRPTLARLEAERASASR